MTSVLFETISLADETKLVGRHWAVQKPKAVMSLVHGLGEHSGRYESLAPDLVKAGVAVVAIDLRGHGQSDGKRGVCTDYALLRSDLQALLDTTRRLYPQRPHFLYGHSMGGGVVLDYGFTAEADIMGIMASAPFILLPKSPPAILRGLAKVIAKIAPQATMRQPLSGDKISTLPVEQESYEADPLNHNQIGFGFAMDALAIGQSISDRAGLWSKPLLLMHAKEDQLTSFQGSESFAEAGRNIVFRAYENSEHEMHHDTPRAEVLSEMIAFINTQIKMNEK
ncbi:alpha-beta hydrolase superfamily lysophospholipase [Litorimonas taeanensis]|uniref:Alpha-beta hydrolase superfamily lysophospholipase n=1 Tax=Litorimonas taeanensis TaxID=568099 RepID=A0A420WDJ0_9PROT|nr:alpha-beta hydrolase superfamily lysophospholipase [Litorimonas taeanensis]